MIALTLMWEKIMRYIMLLLVLVSSNLFAMENQHFYPAANIPMTTTKQAEELKYPGYCEIEIVNNSCYNVRVSGVFDDGEILRPFKVYAHEYPHYISLYYYGYCHYGMDIFIETTYGYRIYADYTRRYETIYISSYMYAGSPKISAKLEKSNHQENS